MSARNNKIQTKKPYCKVCHDAGKSESEYTNHYVRSFPDKSGNSKVTCPTLLATECRYCYELGHTTKFCTVLAKNKKSEERAYRQAEHREATENVKPKAPPIKKNVSGFEVLRELDESEEKTKAEVKAAVSKPTVVEEFPSLGSQPVIVKEKQVMTGWAAVAAKTAEQFDREKYEQQLIANSIKRQMPTPLSSSRKIVMKSWADWTDSDTEDEEEMPSYKNVEADEDW